MAGSEDHADLTMEVPDFTQFAYYIDDDSLKRKILKLWSQRIRTFLMREFKKNSQGGGRWKPLKIERNEPSPAKQAKKNSEQVSVSKHFENQAILIDTGTLYKALDPNVLNPGALEKISYTGNTAMVSVGWGGPAIHPPSKRKSSKKTPHVTVGEIAVLHHYGTGAIPARPLLVPPDDVTIRGLTEIAQEEILKVAKKVGG